MEEAVEVDRLIRRASSAMVAAADQAERRPGRRCSRRSPPKYGTDRLAHRRVRGGRAGAPRWRSRCRPRRRSPGRRPDSPRHARSGRAGSSRPRSERDRQRRVPGSQHRGRRRGRPGQPNCSARAVTYKTSREQERKEVSPSCELSAREAQLGPQAAGPRHRDQIKHYGRALTRKLDDEITAKSDSLTASIRALEDSARRDARGRARLYDLVGGKPSSQRCATSLTGCGPGRMPGEPVGHGLGSLRDYERAGARDRFRDLNSRDRRLSDRTVLDDPRPSGRTSGPGRSLPRSTSGRTGLSWSATRRRTPGCSGLKATGGSSNASSGRRMWRCSAR
jgi:hypothetical protein